MSEYRGPVADWTFIADADLRNYRYRIVKIASDGHVDVSTASSDAIVGVLQNNPNIGEQAQVRIFGGSKLYVDGTTDIGAGDYLTATTAGVGIKTVSNQAVIVGRAFHAETDAGPYIHEVFVNVQTLAHS